METSTISLGQRDALHLLQKNELFCGVSQDELRSLLPELKLTCRIAGCGETVIRIGEETKLFYIVVSGRMARQRAGITSETPHRFGYYRAGDIFGVEAYFSGPKRSHMDVIAVEDSVLLCLLPDALYSDLCCGERLMKNTLHYLANSSIKNTHALDILLAPSLREKILTFFRNMKNKFNSNSVTITMNQSQLADYLGVNRSAMSRELHKMEDEGILKIGPQRSYEIMKWPNSIERTKTSQRPHNETMEYREE